MALPMAGLMEHSWAGSKAASTADLMAYPKACSKVELKAVLMVVHWDAC